LIKKPKSAIIYDMNILKKTQSICPVCSAVSDAAYVEKAGSVYFVNRCTEHGETEVKVSDDVAEFLGWTDSPVVNIPPKTAVTKGVPGECPLHCGTCENHLQTACCILIDITERCNQHCPYCFAVSGREKHDAHEPSLTEMDRKFDLLLELGEERPFNIQLSGGEPTVRDDLPEIISLAREKGFEYIQINSNGRRIGEEEDYARVLKEAGASVIFMQFDGTDDDIYMTMRNEPLLAVKKKAVENCRKAGLAVTLVPTVVNGVNSQDIGNMMDFLLENIDVVKGIHFQPVSYFGRYPGSGDSGRINMFRVLREIEKQTKIFRYEDFCPIATGHPLCCFYSTYMKTGENSVKCMLSPKAADQGVDCCGGACGGGSADSLEIIKKDRDYVLNKWDLPEPEKIRPGEKEKKDGSDVLDISGPVDMDEFIKYYRRNTFTVTGMAFMDNMDLDAERLKRCRVQQLTEDDRLIPFCAYNSIYRRVEL